MIKAIMSVIVLVFSFQVSSAQSSFFGQSENENEIFGSYKILGNSGVIGYGLSHESDINRDSVITEFINDFGPFDEALNKNTFLWTDIRRDKLYHEPFDLEMSAAEIMKPDGKTSSGITLIELEIETKNEASVLNPDSEFYGTFVSYFDSLIEEHLENSTKESN